MSVRAKRQPKAWLSCNLQAQTEWQAQTTSDQISGGQCTRRVLLVEAAYDVKLLVIALAA